MYASSSSPAKRNPDEDLRRIYVLSFKMWICHLQSVLREENVIKHGFIMKMRINEREEEGEGELEEVEGDDDRDSTCRR